MSSLVFSRCPAAQKRMPSPAAAITKPIATSTGLGAASQTKTATKANVAVSRIAPSVRL